MMTLRFTANGVNGLLLGAALLGVVTTARADVGPPVKITMPRDTPQATSGVAYAGAFEIHLAQAGELANFKLEGEGWTVLSVDTPADPSLAEVGMLRVSFRAVPRHANRPIRLSFTYDGRRVSKAYEVGPRYFSRAGKAHLVQSVGGSVESKLTVPIPQDAGESQAAARGGAIPLRFTGRFVYTRTDGRTLGADSIWVEVMDDDGLASDALVDESIWSSRTDENGYFDSGVIWWDDCDITGCDVPDIYVRFECDTAVGQVQDSGVLEEDYFWSTMDQIREDFTGSEIHFGTMWPGDAAERPAVHIWNSLVRTHRYIQNITGINVDHVDIQWPESQDGAWYDEFYDEIHIGPNKEWLEGTVSHEYGHHFMAHYSINQSPDYCNNYCDGGGCTAGTNCENTGHCTWCPETDHDTWNEGWPDWLADTVLRSYPLDYQFDDCTPYTPLDPRNYEQIARCCQDDQFHDPWITEGFTAALLRDIDDERDDAHDPNDDDNRALTDTTDCMALGPDEIFTVVTQDQPHNSAEFISMFLNRYPEHTAELWQTAQNVAPEYVVGTFPADTTPPGAITVLDSPSHPSGIGGAFPCITVEWEPPPDDATGIHAHSIAWNTDPGVVADTTIDWIDTCVSQTEGPPVHFGEYYVSIRAMDWADHWGPATTFGPFAVNEDCNNNGIMDVCDVACDASSYSGDPQRTQCTIPSSFCNVSGCGASQDCNANGAPDECDLASGTSKDCDRNGIPDECDDAAGFLDHWTYNGSGSWHNADNWYALTACPVTPPPPVCDSLFPADCPAVPSIDDNVCIEVPAQDVTVSYSSGDSRIWVLACYESLNVGGGSPTSLKIDRPSWVDGNLGLSGNNVVLEVTQRLDIGGVFNWTGSNLTSSAKLKGAGITSANGGIQVSEVVHLDGHHLVLDGNSTSVTTTGRVDFISPSVFEIRPGSTYEHQGSGYIFNGWFDDRFVNGGTLIKSVDPGTSWIYMFTSNSGLIHVQAGTLKFYLGSSSTGDYLADPSTTLEFNGGGHEFLPSSNIVADNIHFSSGASGANMIRGSYNVTTATTVQSGQVLTFATEANIINYGPSFLIPFGTVNFDAVIGGNIQFDLLSLGTPISAAGNANFNSGDPVQITNLIIGPGTIHGPSPITITGLTTWNASGHFSGPGPVHVDGDLLVNPGGGEKTISNCVFNNAGTATLLGWFSMSSSAVFNNLANGVIDIQVDGNVISGLQQMLNNAGTLLKSAGTGTSTISAPTINTGTVEVQTGKLEFYTYYNGSYVQTAGQTVLNGGDVKMLGPAPLQIDGGRLTGAGTITGNVLVNNNATAAPGLSPGILDIVGNYTQVAGGALEIDIAGLTQGSEYDLLSVSGTASVAGDLEVIISTNGFTPASGDSLQILTAGVVIGQFSSVNVSNLPPPLNVEVVYTPTDVTLHVVGPAPGDCNLDGNVDLIDFGDLGACLLGPSSGIGAGCDCFDFDGSGHVDLDDFAAFQKSFIGSW